MAEFYYETHLHTCAMSRCASMTPEGQVELYHSLGYAGIIVTEHFFNNGSNRTPKELEWKDRIDCYRSSYYAALVAGKKYDMDIMFGIESTYHGNDFLIYGADPDWLKANPDMLSWSLNRLLRECRANGCVVVHAHPFREEDYIDMIRLVPREVDGVEVYNGNNRDFENDMAVQYAANYGLGTSAGSDNHHGEDCRQLCGIIANKRYSDPKELVLSALRGESRIFHHTVDEMKQTAQDRINGMKGE